MEILHVKFNINNLKKVILDNKMLILQAFALIVFPILLSAMTYDSYHKKVMLNTLEQNIKDYPRNSYEGKSFPTYSFPILRDVVMVGDSYSHFLSYNLGFDITNYSCPGLKLEYLDFVVNSAIPCKKKYAVIFIGPNDFDAETEPKDFKNLLEKYVNRLRTEMGATVILSTYMKSRQTIAYENAKVRKFTIKEYNDELLKLIDEKNKIYYLDISMLDDLDKYSVIEDAIHFNKEFYIDYVNKLYDKLLEIKRDEITNDR